MLVVWPEGHPNDLRKTLLATLKPDDFSREHFLGRRSKDLAKHADSSRGLVRAWLLREVSIYAFFVALMEC